MFVKWLRTHTTLQSGIVWLENVLQKHDRFKQFKKSYIAKNPRRKLFESRLPSRKQVKRSRYNLRKLLLIRLLMNLFKNDFCQFPKRDKGGGGEGRETLK